ncbi:MAG TPA: LysR substrate-binding domain-containing protein [Planctomycetota bacterium]|nr:LysR substrate-binding domain-containing protein [Planctomycetota bacterium]
MELRLQRYFIAVAEELHFGRAASRLKISQPSLSKQIRLLELEVGTSLLWRTKREVRLTPAGQSFLQHSREVLNQVERSITEAHSVGRGDLGRLEIGYLSSASPRIVPRVVQAFRKQYPRVDVRLQMLMPPHHLSELRNSQVDFLFLGLPVEAPDLVVEKIVEEPFIVAIPEGHPLARRKRMTWKSLDGVPVVIWPRRLGPEPYDKIVHHFKIAGARFNTALETFPLNSLVCAVAAGIGISFVPDCAHDNPQKRVVYRSLVPPRPTTAWGILYHRESLGGAQEAFLRVVRKLYRMPAKTRR